MLEAFLIMSIVYACLYMPLRGKEFESLCEKHKKRVEKNFSRYQKTRKGKQNPDMTAEEYLPILQKQGPRFLIAAIVIFPIYLLIVVSVYAQMFAL